jgi:glycerol-3-phosphate acyltransferase PlsX
MGKYQIVVDAMGSDGAPEVEVKASMEAVAEFDDIVIKLVGKEEEINKYLTPHDRIEVIHAEDIITNHDDPVRSIRRKKEASIVKALTEIKEGRSHAIVGAGSTGALLTGATLILGRIKGVSRPALGPVVTAVNGRQMVMIDIGATSDARPEYLVQNALMGQIYSKVMTGTEKPTVGLLNIGAEAKKGNELYVAAHKLLAEDESVNFVGNVEARDILNGEVDVLVSDGFGGNIMLKTVEGTALAIFDILKQELTSSFLSKILTGMLRNKLRNVKKRLDYTETGGASLVGVNGIVIKTHGSANVKAYRNAIKQARLMTQKDVVNRIKEEINS